MFFYTTNRDSKLPLAHLSATVRYGNGLLIPCKDSIKYKTTERLEALKITHTTQILILPIQK